MSDEARNAAERELEDTARLLIAHHADGVQTEQDRERAAKVARAYREVVGRLKATEAQLREYIANCGETSGSLVEMWRREADTNRDAAALLTRLSAERDEALEEAAKVIEPKGKKPCDCITLLDDKWWLPSCDCRNGDDSDIAMAWCESMNNAHAIRALKSTPQPS